MFNTQILAGSSGQGGITQQSLKFNDDESQYLSWTPAAAGNRKTWTWSGWVKLAQGTAPDPSTIFGVGGSSSGDLLQVTGGDDGLFRFFQNGGNTGYLVCNGKLRDYSAWYHIVLAVDTTQATSSDRIKLYLNGEQLTSFSTATYPSQNYDGGINNNVQHGIGRDPSNQYSYYDGYLSDVYFIDGQALDPTSFGQFNNGYWEAKDYAGSYGTNGFHLTFADDVVSEGFNAVTYRGTGATQSISGLGFEPDFVWIKDRTTAYDHHLFDTVRGGGNSLYSNDTVVENTYATDITFDADGFTVANGSGVPQIYINKSGDSFVAWAWDAGTGSAASNTDGSITSTVKANPSYGFSVVSWTGNATAGATIGHGLGVAPSFVISKRRDAADDWSCYHSSLGGTKYIDLNSTAAAGTSIVVWNNTNPSSSVVTLGTSNRINGSGATYIAYCFAEVANYSSIGSYSGTGASGNAVTTGFRPAFLMIKRTDTTGNWEMFDDMRNISNDPVLYANTSAAESAAAGRFTFTSTGFTLDDTGGGRNASGGTYIYMAFADTREAAFWKDVSGQGNHWTPNNLDYRDSLIDSPANNFAVMNPLASNSNVALSEGNLKATLSSTADHVTSGTIAASAGSFYAEFTITNFTSSSDFGFGVVKAVGLTGNWTADGTKVVRLNGAGNYYKYLVFQGTVPSFSYAAGDIIGVAYDADLLTVKFYLNGSLQITITGLDDVDHTFYAAGYASGGAFAANFGQDSTFSGARPAGGNQDDNGIGDFAYPVPAGFLSLCSASLPTPSIVDWSTAFSTVLWTGDNTTPRSLTNSGQFQPDFVWIKNRSNAYQHNLYDSVRGAGSAFALSSDGTGAEGGNSSTYGYLSSFDSTGFTVTQGTAGGGAAPNGNAYTNQTASAYVGWNWKAGGTAVSNTDGTITSQVSANTTSGFSIATFTAPTSGTCTVGHGLNVAPECFFIKSRANAYGWTFYHKDIGSNKYLVLNSTAAAATDTNTWNNTAPTSSVFTLGLNFQNTSTWVAYCFANSDIIKVGTYTGNGSADGPMVFTGGRVQWLMIKRTDSTSDWWIWDVERNTYNVAASILYANDSSAEFTSTSIFPIDLVSNGFKHRGNNVTVNGSGATYIYLAIMESPLKHSNAR